MILAGIKISNHRGTRRVPGEVASAAGGGRSERNEAPRSKGARAPSGKQLSGTARGQKAICFADTITGAEQLCF